ncbi:Transcription factor [Penicillium coprophilum]|uniref:Transcription factor n=1 Tax=Penicillium coprophilum TaxID=36646 RepID=UPI002393EEA5|nr:Transcription factor [Penicillium coprophilum]KAJ5159331.1 Transcription factor [Penicillium coprophilum]
MSFSRKRAALACTFCRSRKRRCDAQKPSCAHCRELEVECHYDDLPSQRIDTSGGTREILNRLHDIEAILQTQSHQISDINKFHTDARPVPKASSPGNAWTLSREPPNATMASPWSFFGLETQSNLPELPPLTIPVKHKTSSSYLLSLPPVKSLIGEYPTDVFFQLESRAHLPPELSCETWPTPIPSIEIERDLATNLVSTFFASAHHAHPILDPGGFEDIFSRFLENGPDSSIASALCMVVLALGAVAASRPDTHAFLHSPPGMAYIQHALPTLLSQSAWSFSCCLMLPQALVLASVYFAYIVRPLQSWRLIYSATTLIQFKLSGIDSQQKEPWWRENLIRLFWSCFLIECDRLAELELPRSGLQQLTDEISLPECTNLGMMQSTCYLAEISIRRLLNRVHNSLYPSKNHGLTLSSTSLATPEEFSMDDISSMSAVCDELHSQLELWHSSIPEDIRPKLNSEPSMQESNDRQAILRIRYFAARHIIYRPFVLFLVTHDVTCISHDIVKKAGICIESCRRYIHSTTRILKQPSQYTWTFSLSSLGAIVILTLASLNPALQHLVTDIDALQSLALNNIRPWAFSSLEAVITILEDVQKKQRLFKRMY